MCGCDKGGNSSTVDTEAQEVQAAWNEFKEASLSGKGEVAANRVTSATHDYYTEIGSLALRAGRDELLKMSLAKQITVLGMRVRMDSQRLKEMSGRDLFVHAVDKGWIGKTSATDEGISKIQVTGAHARAEATKAGKPTGQYLHFLKEGEVWRLDMMHLMKFVNTAFEAMHKQSGMSEEEFVSRMIERVTSKRLTADDWNAISD
jgi:hypothetical protein